MAGNYAGGRKTSARAQQQQIAQRLDGSASGLGGASVSASGLVPACRCPPAPTYATLRPARARLRRRHLETVRARAVAARTHRGDALDLASLAAAAAAATHWDLASHCGRYGAVGAVAALDVIAAARSPS